MSAHEWMELGVAQSFIDLRVETDEACIETARSAVGGVDVDKLNQLIDLLGYENMAYMLGSFDRLARLRRGDAMTQDEQERCMVIKWLSQALMHMGEKDVRSWFVTHASGEHMTLLFGISQGKYLWCYSQVEKRWNESEGRSLPQYMSLCKKLAVDYPALYRRIDLAWKVVRGMSDHAKEVHLRGLVGDTMAKRIATAGRIETHLGCGAERTSHAIWALTLLGVGYRDSAYSLDWLNGGCDEDSSMTPVGALYLDAFTTFTTMTIRHYMSLSDVTLQPVD